MIAMVKVLLAKHKYPPDAQAEATDKVIAQAELLADTWAFRATMTMTPWSKDT
jgi:type I restriction enzyme R subunit